MSAIKHNIRTESLLQTRHARSKWGIPAGCKLPAASFLMTVLAAMVATLPALAQTEPEALSLAGTWEYRLDPDDQGIEEAWYDQAFEKTIQLPGTLDDAGIGDRPEVDAEALDREVLLHLTRKHSYTGVAWYRREIRIPESWKDKRISLLLERVIWSSMVWVDGQQVGAGESLNTPHRYRNLRLEPGKHVLVIRIDNSKQYDISYRDMAHAYTNETQIMWNGMLGKLRLEAVPEVSIASLQVFPDVSRQSVTARIRIANHGAAVEEKELQVNVRSRDQPAGSKTVSVHLPEGASEHEASLSLGPDARYWDEFAPHLYTLEARLGGAGHVAGHQATATFGLREWSTLGQELLLNGSRRFLRGTLECGIFPLTGYPPTGKEGWLKVFSAARDHGLNHLRFHSWCPPEAAFEVADSMGFYLQAELPLWIKGFGKDTAAVRFIRDEARRMIEAYGNHPSFCFWSLGNELEGDFELLGSIAAELKEEDPRRLYATTTFTFQKGHGDWPEEQDDFFVTQWTKNGWVRGQGIFNDQAPDFDTDYSAAAGGLPVPLITHEIGQYSVYPDMDEIQKYTGVLEPLNFMAIRRDLQRKGMLDEAPAFALASGKLAALLYKEEIERALKTGNASGFQLLDLHDFPGQGTALVGLLDAFWDSKDLISPEEFRRFCGPVVPLLRYPKAVYTNGEVFEASAELANYGADSFRDQEVRWELTAGTTGHNRDKQDRVLASGKLGPEKASAGAVTPLGRIRVPLAEVKQAEKLSLRISLPGTSYQNAWDIWVYPENLPPLKGDVSYTRSPEEALTLLKEGKKVLLNPDSALLKGVEGRFTPVFWSPVHFPDQPGTMGILCQEEHPAFTDFPTEFHTNWQWWNLIMSTKTLIIDSLPDITPLAGVVDNFFKNRKMALILEARVGRGSLLLCAPDIGPEASSRHPEAKQLRYSLLKYMESTDFRPQVRLRAQDLDLLIQNRKP